jgi:flavin reductase (DIM6/NTAB) family NADH-FMN oxidoreductase RutF
VKIERKPETILAPVPVVMVSCEAPGFRKNIITIAWAGTICSGPPMLSISIRPERYSYAIIRESMEFVVNLPNRELLAATDYCGSISGREVDKFKAAGLTPGDAKIVKAPLIKEAPLNIECRVKQIVPLGTHDLFIAEVVQIHVNEDLPDQKGAPDLTKMEAICYGNGSYYQVGTYLNQYGFARNGPGEFRS